MANTTAIFPSEREQLYHRFSDRMEIAYNLNRKIVSFQANKDEPIYRWFKYKEGFSSALVKYFLSEYAPNGGKVLDPFAGAGTTLFAGQEMGWEPYGVELLPVGAFIMQTREAVEAVNKETLKHVLNSLWADLSKVEIYENHINHISITRDAFSEETEMYLNKYLSLCAKHQDKVIRTILQFAAFSILEEISYTRKDGQYLRWDYRSKRELSGKPFDKGKIMTFEHALRNKFAQISADIVYNKSNSLFDQYENASDTRKPLNVTLGSCLEKLPGYEDNFFDFIITSPPYCNRYDYTRTYALELVYLGYNNEQVRSLRQSMLSCTVENKEKTDQLYQFYQSIGKEDSFQKVIEVYNNSAAMSEVNSILDVLNNLDKLNNNNIPRMVRNYFLELCFVVFEMARILRHGGFCVMVNDNVRYGGEEIPVDLILSEFAESFGFCINKIFVLPKGKGNSSQQMGNYGRAEVRKCVYLWQKK